jgi:signal transduction histidine kinase/CheY-like chemotaxis protein
MDRSVTTFRKKPGLAALLLASSLLVYDTQGAWLDHTAGQPVLQVFSAKELGVDTVQWIILHDPLGRLFVGDKQLRVFDGQTWQSYPMAETDGLHALAFGENGRLWAGSVNEVGYFTEESLGNFQYHSLMALLPDKDRNFGLVWDCAIVGRAVYFFCQTKLLRWDGAHFQAWDFPTKHRLFPLRLKDELWFHVPGSGLYRVTEEGPDLAVSEKLLPPSNGVLGMIRDDNGLLTISREGIYRPGQPPILVSKPELTQYLFESHPACFVELPDGRLAIGTVGGGLVIATKTGEIVRRIDRAEGLPANNVSTLTTDSAGYIWGSTNEGMIRFEARGHETTFGPATGLKGPGIIELKFSNAQLHALTSEGLFIMDPANSPTVLFAPPHQQTRSTFLNHLLPFRQGLLVSRFAGMDFFDGKNFRSIFDLPGKSTGLALIDRTNPSRVYISEPYGLGRMTVQAEGQYAYNLILDLPDRPAHIYQDAKGQCWLGTENSGAFLFDPRNQQSSPILDPVNGRPFTSRVMLHGDDQHLFLFNHERLLLAGPEGEGLHVADGVPPIQPSACLFIPGSENLLVAFKHPNASDASAHNLGIVAFDQTGRVVWHELDVPALRSVGFVRTMAFSSESGRPVLWIGGTDGLLRLDYDTLAPTKNPDTPLIRLDDGRSSRTQEKNGLSFPFANQRISLRVFTGDYSKSKDWLLQSRLEGEWSAPSAARSFEFTNLSEGDYRFEVRSVNAAGLTSEPAALTFRVLPPWYRSAWAYTGYLGLFAGGVIVLIRARERQIRIRNQELEKTVALRTEELVKASAAKDEFLAGISHEIRNPMNGVIGIAETFRTDTLDAEGRHKFGLLRQCANHLSSLLEDILDFSRVQAGQVDLEPKPFDVPELTESIAAITASESQRRGIPVEIAVSPAVPAQLVGDARRIRQILLNFIANALKFSSRGQVSVTIWCKAAGPDRTEVIFAVSDEGPGISPEEQKRLFTRFERGAAAQSGRVPGTGLGLALCKGLAEKMGGRIWLESEPGQGSCFYFSATFPVPETSAPPAAAIPADAPGHGRCALVVDDEEYNRIAMTDLLENLGFTVLSAGDGPAALALAAGREFDAAFLDYDLPGMSGLDTSRALRALPNASARALIVATTAFTTQEKRDQCTAAGMDTFLGKPVTMDRLRKVLAAAAGTERTSPAPLEPAAAPVDSLANLRLITRRKGTPFAEELALYLSEFGVELDHLAAALQRQNAAETGHYAHLLYGRSAFIAETELEQTLRNIEAAAAAARWEEAQALGRQAGQLFAALRVRMTSAASAGPRA